jgi:predicted MFS family arabinose efflux permease
MILQENKGIPIKMVVMLSIIAGFMVANIYYNQPLLEVIARELRVTSIESNLLAVFTQVGYAFGLLLIIPMGDLYNRRKLTLACIIISLLMTAIMSVTYSIYIMWIASFFIGISSIVPQIFMPIAGQFSEPENKSRNMGYILTGLLVGILASRVLGGLIGKVFGWRMIYEINIIIMVLCAFSIWKLFPNMKRNFTGNYAELMCSVFHIFKTHPRIRLNSIRAGLAFGSMLSIWSCMAFHLSGAPFYAGSDMVGMLGLCGVAGAVASMNIGKYVSRVGIRRFSLNGASLQVVAWLIALLFSRTYGGLIFAVVLVDIGLQCQQLSNQSGCIQELPSAASRVNTIFMTTYFVYGAMGTFVSSLGWNLFGWAGVCMVGAFFACGSILISLREKSRLRKITNDI